MAPPLLLSAPSAVPSKSQLRFGDVIKETSTSDGIVRQTSLMQLIRVMDQVSNLSLYANGIMSDLADASDFAIQRTEEVRKRLEAIKGAVPTVEEKLATAGLADSMNHERFDWKSQPRLSSNLFTKDTENPSLRVAYEACNDAPNLFLMDQYRTDGQNCMKFYSYPEFFAEEWKLLMQKEIDEEKRRKKERRELRKKAKLQRPTTMNKVQVQELSIKRYNSQGELITAGGSAVDDGGLTTLPARRISIGSVENIPFGPLRSKPIAIKPWDQSSARTSVRVPPWDDKSSRPSRSITQLGQGKSTRTRVNAPPPPPPPPPPPGMGPPPPPHTVSGAPAAAANKPQTPTGPKPGLGAPGGLNFLNEIRGGQFSLKKVEAPSSDTKKRKVESGDVAAILMRRVAMEMSDSEDDESGDDEDWE